MRLTQALFVTQRERPAGRLIPAEEMLLRAGLLHEVAPGADVRTPLLLRTLARVGSIVRERLTALGCEPTDAPSLLPGGATDAELVTQERGGTRHRLLGSTRDPIDRYVADRLASYRQLPIRVLVNARVFSDTSSVERIRSDRLARDVVEAHGYDVDNVARAATVEALRAAVADALELCGVTALAARASSADPFDVRFVAPVDGGDETVVDARQSGAVLPAFAEAQLLPPPPSEEPEAPMRRVETPGACTIAELREVLPDVHPARTLKTMLYRTDEGDVVAALCRGDREIDERKLSRHLGDVGVALADEATIRDLTGAEPGFSGPVGLPDSVRIVADRSVAALDAFVCGANETDAHLTGVRFEHDLPLPELADLDAIRDGDPAPGGDGTLRLVSGLAVAEVTGQQPTAATYSDHDGQQQDAWACGARVDLGRTILACVGQNLDDDGIRWPLPVAPHSAVVIQARSDDDHQTQVADDLHRRLSRDGVDALWDDRPVRIGVKFNDAELVGIPIRIVVGRDAADARVELRLPDVGTDGEVVTVDDAAARVTAAVHAAKVPPAP